MIYDTERTGESTPDANMQNKTYIVFKLQADNVTLGKDKSIVRNLRCGKKTSNNLSFIRLFAFISSRKLDTNTKIHCDSILPMTDMH